MSRGIKKELDEEVQKSKRLLASERVRFLEALHLYEEVQSLCEEHEGSKQEEEAARLCELWRARESAFLLEEEGSLLGVTEDKLFVPSTSQMHAMLRKTLPLLEQRLDAKSAKLAAFAESTNLEKLLVDVREAKEQTAQADEDEKNENRVLTELMKAQELLLAEIGEAIADLKYGRGLASTEIQVFRFMLRKSFFF